MGRQNRSRHNHNMGCWRYLFSADSHALHPSAFWPTAHTHMMLDLYENGQPNLPYGIFRSGSKQPFAAISMNCRFRLNQLCHRNYVRPNGRGLLGPIHTVEPQDAGPPPSIVGPRASGHGPFVLGLLNNWTWGSVGMPSLFTHQFQAKPCRCSC